MSEILKVSDFNYDFLVFENGYTLECYHSRSCCEEHYLDWSNYSREDFIGLEFDISSEEKLFTRVDGYGIRLKPLNGHEIPIPGYAENNGYYCSNLSLRIYDSTGDIVKEFDITECQEWKKLD